MLLQRLFLRTFRVFGGAAMIRNPYACSVVVPFQVQEKSTFVNFAVPEATLQKALAASPGGNGWAGGVGEQRVSPGRGGSRSRRRPLRQSQMLGRLHGGRHGREEGNLGLIDLYEARERVHDRAQRRTPFR